MGWEVFLNQIDFALDLPENIRMSVLLYYDSVSVAPSIRLKEFFDKHTKMVTFQPGD